jgi:hypothetical protein
VGEKTIAVPFDLKASLLTLFLFSAIILGTC